MSALAHEIEHCGVPTVVIALIRLHAELIEPPRALWVPFELGRPLGPPGDPAFQRRVIAAGLALLEHGNGPVVLEDFADEDPRRFDDPFWQSPLVPNGSANVTAGALMDEFARIEPHHRSVTARMGRTTVGLIGGDLAEAVATVAKALSAGTPVGNGGPLRPAEYLRYAADDLKAGWLEAARGGGGRPSSRQLMDWFWNETVAARALHRLRSAALASEDRVFAAVCGRQLVPRIRIVAD